jgi:purine-cytosine permease-like protein
MGILEPPENSGPVGGFVWFLFLLVALPVVLIVVPAYYFYKSKKEIAEKVEELGDEEIQREIHSGFQWRAILRGLIIFIAGCSSIIGALCGLLAILYNIETPDGFVPPLSMGQAVGIFLLSLVLFALLVKKTQITSFGEGFSLNRM